MLRYVPTTIDRHLCAPPQSQGRSGGRNANPPEIEGTAQPQVKRVRSCIFACRHRMRTAKR
eukprot:5532164-Pleurochrysis_carterae.AAC.1